MDELIADLETVAPPERSKFGGNPEDFTDWQKWSCRLLRRFEDAYPDDIDQDDPEVQREILGVQSSGRPTYRFMARRAFLASS